MESKPKEGNICLLYNYAQHYRLGIFKLLNDKLFVDFYFGDKMEGVKKLDYSKLSLFKKELKNKKIVGPLYWQSGALSVLFKPYTHYIILGEYFCLSTWLLAIMAPIYGKKVYFWTHGWYGKEGKVMSLIKKLFFKLADHIFLYGERAKKLMIQKGFDANRLHVIYNSLDYEKQIEVRSRLEPNDLYHNIFKNNFPSIVFIGRLTKVKKLTLIIDAMKILKQKGVNVNVCFIGEGEEKSVLESVANQYGLEDQVYFTGALYDEATIANYIYNADVCVSPGNVGLTAMHSLVFGTPVITNNDFNSQMPEFEAIVEGVTGDFFMDNNINDLALKIECWVNPNGVREKARLACFQRIDKLFNPFYQLEIFKNVIKTNN
ncbi:hypothetical protein GCM10009120_28150 [Sphingobacterium siyangense subsp. cladoniae]|uniref:glycosyltransferase family 4 protein n=1 Tax=Sphingobacterium siyangense TaxID=459529 RepID=UPI0031F7766E